jgi:hypothetical protein
LKYKVLKIKSKKRFRFTKASITILIFVATILVSIYSYFFIRLLSINDEYRKNISELKIDSIKSGRTLVNQKPKDNCVYILGLTYHVKMRNESNSICFIKSIMSYDTSFTQKPILRNRILYRDTTNIAISENKDLRDFILNPKESKWFEVKTNVNPYNAVDKVPSYLHCMFLYSNVNGGYYDVYAIQKVNYIYEPEKPIKYTTTDIDTINRIISFHFQVENNPEKMVEFKEYIQLEPFVYSYKDKEYIEDIKIK